LTVTRIGLISDTHLYGPLPEDLAREVAIHFQSVDMILHAGDLYTADVLDDLERFAPVRACVGFGTYTKQQDPRFLQSHVFEAGGIRIGLYHAFDYPPVYPQRTLESLMQAEFNGPVHVLVHGDTHVPRVEWFNNVLLLNPGSPTLPYNCTDRPGTLGILTISNGIPSAEIIMLDYPVKKATH